MGFRMVIFTDSSSLVGSSSIEIAESDEPQAVRSAVGFQCVLECQLGCAIGIDGLTRAIFSNRASCWIAINCRRRRKDELAHARIHDRIQQRDCSRDIVLKIFSWILYRLAHVGVRRKMHNGIAAVEGFGELRGIRDITDDEFESCRQLFMAGAKVVINDDFVAPALECVRSVTANVASSPNH